MPSKFKIVGVSLSADPPGGAWFLGRVGSVRREGVESKKFRETFAKVGLGSRERKKESWAILKESLTRA